MSAPITLEQTRLRGAEAAVAAFAQAFGEDREEARMQLLETAAARLGSHDPTEYHQAFGRRPLAAVDRLDPAVAAVLDAIGKAGIAPALALSALAREGLSAAAQRTTGAYHTDFRLAARLAQAVAPGLALGSKVLDPACGSGMLLVALTLAVCGNDRRATARWLGESVHASDLSPAALRGAALALAALTDDLGAVVRMRQRWRVGDSLTVEASTWERLAPGGFDAIVANPPWEKVRLTQHEFHRGQGGAAVPYGSALEGLDQAAFAAQAGEVRSYAGALAKRFPVLLRGEPDLYAAFVALCLNVLRPGGHAGFLVPGGLIRSQGTQALREVLWEQADHVGLAVFDNRSRFFGIDTRFKFLAMHVVHKTGEEPGSPIVLTHEAGTPNGTQVLSCVALGRDDLRAVRPDLSVPEVSDEASWELFRRMARQGERADAPGSPWRMEVCREVDMTAQRPSFVPLPGPGWVAVVEGRHVHQHRLGAKAYVGGAGRAALWRPCPLGEARVVPQFFIAPTACSLKAQERIGRQRAGFCDIAGQTNERSMMAAMIEPGLVCGNKVPTVLFTGEHAQERLWVWLAVVNSLAFDWMLRRVLTTTINYFVLLSLPLPSIAPGGAVWNRLVAASRDLHALHRGPRTEHTDRWTEALRTGIEVDVAQAYGLSSDDLQRMASDFPLLDRGQPPLPDEPRSTITRDSVLAALGPSPNPWQARAQAARSAGAIAFVPAQHTDPGVL